MIGASISRRPMRQTAVSMSVRLAQAALVGGGGVVVARVLHPEGRGTYAVATTLATIALAVGHLSVEQSNVALWPGRAAAVTANSALLGPVLGGVAAIGAWCFARGGLAGSAAAHHPGLMLVALVAVPFTMTVLYLNTTLALAGLVGAVDLATILGGVVQAGALVGLALADRLTVGSAVAIWVLGSAVPLVVLLSVARPRLGQADATLARQAVATGIRYHAGSVALYLVFRLDTLLLAVLSSSAAVGLYTVAVTTAEITRLPTDALARTSLARQATADLPSAASQTAQATRTSVLLAVAAVGGFCLVAPVAVPLLYGADFTGAVPAVLALAPGLLALGAGRQVSAFLLRLHRPLTMSLPSIIAAGLTVVANLALIPRWGPVGCALASSLAYVVITAVQVTRFCRASGTPVTQLLPGPGELRALAGWYRHIVAGYRADAATQHVLVAAEPGTTGDEVFQVEAPAMEHAEHLLRAGDLEREAADPVEQVVPAGHATGARRRRGGDGGAHRAQAGGDRPTGTEVGASAFEDQ